MVEQLQITSEVFNGHPFVQVAVRSLDSGGNWRQYSKKLVTIRVSELDEAEKAITAAIQDVRDYIASAKAKVEG